jgi:hypothetical protein
VASFIRRTICAFLVLACTGPALRAAASPAPQAQTQSDLPWPRTVSRNGASVTIYQPQAESWPDRKRLTARAAVEITPAGQTTPLLGTIELSVATQIDAGVVNLSDPQLIGTHFASLSTQQAAMLEDKLRTALPQFDMRPVPLSAVLLSLDQAPAAPVPVNNDPPVIFYSAGPASLVVFDGPPVLAPAGKSGISYAVNTNWNVFAYQGTWYLLNNGQWFSAGATGPYTPVERLPDAFRNLPKDANFAEAKKAIPPHPPQQGYQPPTIFVSMKPAEIIVTTGAPDLQPVQGTSIQRVANTPSTLFFYPPQKLFYVLMSGRWFSAPGLTGPWSYATDKLPGEFAMIPPASPEAAVLPSVPETPQAQDAVLKAQIPTTATLKRATAKITVVYAGPPKFEPIPGTPILRAVNTSTVVLQIDGRFYACVSGAWFVAKSPAGPWVLADSVPKVIKTIPPTSPAYPVTYVDVYAATPTAVTYGYTAGYALGYVSAGVLVYGTGYYYPPYVVPGPVPVFFPYPYSYAGHVYYNSTTGAWARGGTIYGPYGAATGARYYNPSNGAWAQGGAVYGPYGGAGAFSAYNPSTGSYAHGSASWSNGYGTAYATGYNANTGRSATTNQNYNPYGRWGSSTISGPNQTVNTQSRSGYNGSAGSFNSSTGAKGGAYHNSITGSNGGAVKTQNGDVYAGRDGNVYKHTDSGWQKYNNGSWNQVQKPTNNNRTQSSNTARPGGTSGRNYGGYDRGNFQQLDQDRVGRQNGWGLGGGFRGGGRGRFRQ